MKTLKYIFLIIFCSLVLSQEKSSDLELSITLQKNIFFVGEPVWIKVVIINSGNTLAKAIAVDFAPVVDNRSITFDLKDQNNKKINGYFFSGGGFRSVNLQPKDSTYDYFDLLRWFGEPIHPLMSKGGCRYLKSGSYSLVVSVNSFKDTIISNKINFEIDEPKGDMLHSYNLLLDGINTWLIKKDSRKAISILTKVVNLYPNSPYSTLQFDYLYKIYSFGVYHDYNKAISIIKELIEKYPDSPYSLKRIQSISTCYINLNQKEKIDSELELIADMYKNINHEITERASGLIGKFK